MDVKNPKPSGCSSSAPVCLKYACDCSKEPKRHSAVHFCQLMGKGDEWGGITIPGQGFEHCEVVVAKGRWDGQPRLPGSFKFRVHPQTGNTTVAIIEGMHLRDQKKDIERAGRGGRQLPAGRPATGQGFGYQLGSDEYPRTELVVGFF